MSASLLTTQELLLGLFELDDGGKVLYYRLDSTGSSPDMTGHNFYDEVAPFENVKEFRQCVTDFTRSAKPADSFDFACHYDGSDHPVRVLLARIGERVNRHNTKSVLVHIRRGVTLTRSRNTEVNRHERHVD
jgi:hypothetical protein